MISIIIPVWNNPKSLRRALASLEKQTFHDFDVTVIDDGSDTDEAKDVVDGAGSLKIAYHKLEKNSGAPVARNEGAKRSTGEELLFLDADIELDPTALAVMHDTLLAHSEVDFVYSGFRFGWKSFKGRAFDERALRETNYIHTSALMRRSAFPGFDTSLKKFQDWDLWLRMTAQGSRGMWIPCILMRVETGGTMSAWLPSFVYAFPWPLFGWMPRAMKKYLDAEKIIREKHGLHSRRDEEQDMSARFGIHLFIGVAVLEWISFLAYPYPHVMTGIALTLGALFVWVSYRFPLYALMFWMMELMIGSFGGMFRAFGDASLHGGISFRELLFVGYILGSCPSLIQKRVRLTTKVPSLLLLVLVLVSSLLLGWTQNQHANVIADANGWLFFAIIPFFLMQVDFSSRHTWNLIRATCIAGVAYLGLLTLKTWFLYAHPLGEVIQSYTYLWIRRTGLGEITQVISGMQLHRIFFQSQIYAVLALPFLWWWKREKPISFSATLLTILCYATILISLSRSFWVGVGVMCGIAIVFEKKRLSFFSRELIQALVALACVWILAIIPFPPTNASFLAVFGSRVQGEEGAVSSRRTQLVPLLQKIREAPLFGSGFGATVTYTSNDPRVLATGTDQRTTFAFEWGWLDMLVKFGFVGVLVFILCLWQLWIALKRAASHEEIVAWTVALVGLTTVHIFTPYLNHPLGFGFLVLMWMRSHSKSPMKIGE